MSGSSAAARSGSSPTSSGGSASPKQGASGGAAGFSANDANQIAVGYAYNLSKRTALYATVSHIKNDGRAIGPVEPRLDSTTPHQESRR